MRERLGMPTRMSLYFFPTLFPVLQTPGQHTTWTNTVITLYHVRVECFITLLGERI